jgi:o-succinylbenzoate---CoA ligase
MTPADPWIELNGSRYPIGNQRLSIDTSGLGPNQVGSLDFVNSWLEGKAQFIVETSGSTGTPKRIVITRQMMTASARKTIEALGLQEGDTALACLHSHFIAAKMMLVRCLIGRLNIVITEPSVNPLLTIAGDSPIDFAALVPYQVHAAINGSASAHVNRIKKVIIGGAAVDRQLSAALLNVKTQCYATFGMTETISHIALQKINGSDRQDHFTTLRGVTVSTDDRDCLIIDADHLPETIVTNDIVELISTTEFRWLGRWDNVINSGGVKVIPEKIEQIVGQWMADNNYPNRYFASSTPHERLGQQVVLVIEGQLKSLPHLLETMQLTLSKYEVPKQFLCTEKFKETRTGKVDRAATLMVALPCPNP